MGYTQWSSDAYDNFRRSYAGKTREEIFSVRGMHPGMSPLGVHYRESRDSEQHPESLAVQVYLDVTGSMGRIPELLVTQKLGSLMDTLIGYGILHPQILFGAIGDQYTDQCPLQVGQFESGTGELNQWLTNIYLEGGGGGQSCESYQLAWLFAARHTSTDCFEKRGQKGFVFTIGDEWTWDQVSREETSRITGEREASTSLSARLLEEAMRTSHVFHIHINEGSYRNNRMILDRWSHLLGKHFIVLDDYRSVAETIAVLVALTQGIQLDRATRHFNKETSKNIFSALKTFNLFR